MRVVVIARAIVRTRILVPVADAASVQTRIVPAIALARTAIDSRHASISRRTTIRARSIHVDDSRPVANGTVGRLRIEALVGHE